MALLGTSYDDSNFYSRKAAQAAEALSLITGRMEERRLKKEQKEQQEIAKFFDAAATVPELASTWGADIAAKYGDRYPEVRPLVDAINKRYELAKFVPQSGEKWLSEWEQMEAAHQQKGTEIESMPDALPGAFVGPFGAMDLPNVYKQQEREAYNQIDPNLLPALAVQRLSPKERLAAGAWAKGQGYDIPSQTAFDPFKQLPADLAAQLAAQRGYLTGETAQAVRVKTGLEQSPAKLQQQQFSVEDREDRQSYKVEDRESREEFTEKEREARERAAIAKERISHSLAIARDNNRTANDKALITYRESFDEDGEANGDAVVNWKSLEADSKAAQKDYDEELSQAMRGVPAGSKASEIKSNFLKQRGTRPRALSESQARRVAKELKRRIDLGELDPDEAEVASSEIVSDYMSRTAVGVSPEEALKQALNPGEAAPVDEIPQSPARKVPAWAEGALPTEGVEEDGDVPAPPRRGTVATPVKPKAKAPDRATLKSQAKREHPDWTPAQIDAAVDAYLAAKGQP